MKNLLASLFWMVMISLLTTFIILKCMGILQWSWFWVLLPGTLPSTIIVLFFVIVFIIGLRKGFIRG